MSTRLDIAKRLYRGKTVAATGSRGAAVAGGVVGTPTGDTQVRYGYATADSANGWVTVKLDTSASAISCVCDSPIKSGQRVAVLATSAGQLKAQPIGSNIVDEAVDESINQSVSDVTTEYAPGDSADVAPADGWSEAYPTTADYVWQRLKTTKGDGTVTYSTPVCISKPPEGYDRDATYYATSSTGTTTAAKVATVQAGGDFTLKEGATVSVTFDNGNTASNPTLNVDGTGAKPIYTLGTSYAYWAAGASVLFVYDGSAWQVASTPVYASTTTIGNPAGQNVYIDGQGVAMRNGTTEYSTYGPDEIHLGLNASTDANIYLFNDTIRMNAQEASLAIEPVPGKDVTDMRFSMSDSDYLHMYNPQSGTPIGFEAVTELSGSDGVRLKSTNGTAYIDAYYAQVDATSMSVDVNTLNLACANKSGRLGDWVTNHSTSGNWTVREYASGFAELTEIIDMDFPVGGSTQLVSLPVTFDSWQDYQVHLQLLGDTTSYASYFNNIALMAHSFSADSFVIGAWNSANVAVNGRYRVAVHVTGMTS